MAADVSHAIQQVQFVVTPANKPTVAVKSWPQYSNGSGVADPRYSVAQQLLPNKTGGYGKPPPAIVRGSIADPAMNELFQTDRLVSVNNGLVDTIVRCYNHHHNLVLRPEDIWIAIMSQFSLFVNANAERLRSQFVAHTGQKELTVYGSGSLYTAAYEKLCNDMAEEIRKNLVDATVCEWVTPNFSTTTATDKVVGSATLMSAMQKYFAYKMSLMCGIPQVTLQGTPADWMEIKARTQRLSTYGLENWVQLLNPVLDEFIATSQGRSNNNFWQRICHYTSTGSGPTYLSGWVSVFCAFNEKGHWQADTRDVSVWTGQHITNEWPIIDIEDTPPGFVSTPVTVDDNGTIYKTTLWSGSFVQEWSPDKLTAHPRLDWLMTLNAPDTENSE
ncbi:CDP-alcohol phosphatidyltransferase [Pelomyxa schiedti]|nr:CDP-alcohol phosphatidyltransferase [Pelomyxa schiedti]